MWDNYAPNGQEHLCHDPDLQNIMIISHSDIDQDGFAGSNGNIRQDPLFVDSENGDVHLQYGSPCIDKGTSEGAPKYDIDGDVRPQGLGYDIGADEYLLESFADVPPGYWAKDAIYKIYNAGITTGCSKDPLMYCPANHVTRT